MSQEPRPSEDDYRELENLLSAGARLRLRLSALLGELDGIEADARSLRHAAKALQRDIPPQLTGRAQAICDGSGGFGPSPDSGLPGWTACPGCSNCEASR